MIKKPFTWVIALIIGGSCFFNACSDDKTEETPPVEPTLTLTAGEVTQNSLKFAVELKDADKCTYFYTESNASVPSVSDILASGKSLSVSDTVLIEDLKAGTTYRISAVAEREDLFGKVESIEMSTLTPTPVPVVTLTEGTTGTDTLTFHVTLTNAEKAAYICKEKTDAQMPLPNAEEIIKNGTAIVQVGEVTVGELNANTTYVIAVAAANKEVFSEVQLIEMTTDALISGPAVFDRQVAGAYYGDIHETGYAEYHFVLADAETTENDGVYTTVGAGRTMSFDLYQFSPYNLDNITLPARTYRYNTNYGMNTFAPEKTFCMVNNGKGKITKIEFKAGTIEVDLIGTNYTITANLTTTADEEFTASYSGTLNIENKAKVPEGLPQIEKDITGLNFIRALAAYYGTSRVDNCIVNLYDVEPKVSEGSDYLSKAGHLVSLDLSTALSEQMQLQEGTYTASKTSEPGTFLPGYDEEFMGMVLPLGTYCEERNDSYESIYGRITDGTVTISKVTEGYRFVLNFTTDKGYKISGNYEGKVEFTDKRSNGSNIPAAETAKALKIRRQ